MLTLFLGEILSFTWTRRIALLLAGAAWALVTNVARTAVLGWIADRQGMVAMEASHDTAGYTVLVICSLLVGATAWLLHRSVAAAPSTRVDSAGIAQRLRELATPAAACIAILIAGLFLTETWFRLHERSDIPLAPWRFRLPIDRPGFERTTIAPTIRADLRFDEGYGGKWRDESGLRWQALYFRWLPGRNSAQTVGVHDPRACLAAVGMKEVTTLSALDLSRGGIPLPVDAYHFLDGPHDVFVFNCLAEDVRRGESQTRVREDNSISSRFVAALAGKRHRGQRRLEVAVWGTSDANVANAALRKLMDSQIQVGDAKR